MTLTTLAKAAILSACALGPALAQQTSGQVGSGPPEDVFLEITTGTDGTPVITPADITLQHGGFYRLNVVCAHDPATDAGFHFEASDFVANTHIRVMSVGGTDIDFYMQGLTFRAIQCEDPGSARFSFHPMRKGGYPMLVRDQGTGTEASGTITVE